MLKRWATATAYATALVAAFLWLAIGVAQPPQPNRPGFLGIEFAPLTAAAQARAPYLTHGGAMVLKVVERSPAAVAGSKPGDIVIAIDGQPVTSADDAADAIELLKAGAVVALTLYDETGGHLRLRRLSTVLSAAPPENRKVFTVEPPRTLAREWDFKPSMAAHAAWSTAIARGPVDPLRLLLVAGHRCSAVAPEDWDIADTTPDGSAFALVSPLVRARAIYAVTQVGKGEGPEAAVTRMIAKFARVSPQTSASLNAEFGFRVVDFGSSAGYAGFALFRVRRSGRSAPFVSVRIAAVPASDVAELAPLAGAVALSIRCSGSQATYPVPFDDAMLPTSVSSRCLRGSCDEGDFAGSYNAEMHTGYVHSPSGENFLIDPRKDIWMTGPAGPGTYRQVSGTLEKLEPGRTN
jgi:hypothetical protein